MACATLLDFTAYIIIKAIRIIQIEENEKLNISLWWRKKKYFFNESIKKYLPKNNISLNIIDDYKIDGDYIESQAFAYLAIRSYLKLSISYPKTTGCKIPTVGGSLVKNF